jgi:hypothetical protein
MEKSSCSVVNSVGEVNGRGGAPSLRLTHATYNTAGGKRLQRRSEDGRESGFP